MGDQRIQNPGLSALLRDAAGNRFRGDEGVGRLALLVSRRVGFAVSAAAVRSYLNGHRTPPMSTLIAFCEELDICGETLDRAKSLVIDHERAVRSARSPAVDVA